MHQREVRSSNPLCSTKKSPEAAVGSAVAASHSLEAPPDAAREVEANDFADSFRPFDRVVNGVGAERFGEGRVSVDVPGRRVAMGSSEDDDPLIVLQRKDRRPAAGFRQPGQME